jgi:hypothetical protein
VNKQRSTSASRLMATPGEASSSGSGSQSRNREAAEVKQEAARTSPRTRAGPLRTERWTKKRFVIKVLKDFVSLK